MIESFSDSLFYRSWGKGGGANSYINSLFNVPEESINQKTEHFPISEFSNNFFRKLEEIFQS